MKSAAPGAPRILHRFSSRVAVLDEDAPRAPFDDTGLDATERLAVSAWRARSAPRAPVPLKAWNASGTLGEPVHLDAQGEAESMVTEAEPSEAPVGRSLVGSVALGVVIVSRDQGPELVTQAEQTKIVQEVLEATQFLTQVEPRAGVSFDYDFRPLTVTTDPAGSAHASTDAYERLEAPWRDAALLQLGYPAGRAGYRKYAGDLAAQKGTQWSFVAFFTKYPLHHFAYAVYEKVVMAYANDGWGPDNLNAVFAHEACHIFGAADEYGSCGCHTTHGVLQAPNKNCVNCGAARVPCLMDRNELVLCSHSRLQLGWGPPILV